LSTQSSPGKTDIEAKKEGTRKYWFEPRSLKDLKELDFLNSNDTSLGTGFAPRSALEEGTLKLERWISGDEFKKDKPWLGSDIKIMSTRVGNSVKVTMCIPQISKHVKDINEYKQNLTLMRSIILNFLNQQLPQYSIELSINTRDNYELGELYLTAIGSSIESGDEGLVGRGNRPNGVIAVTKPYSIEGACGKNPVYHVGKVYNVAAQNIAEEISNKVNVYVEVFLVSQSGRSLIDPWVTVVGVNKKITPEEREEMEKIVKQNLQEIPKITKELLDNSIKLC
jgi:S-adenosylmethionine synthetase